MVGEKFQFHTGTIKTNLLVVFFYGIVWFQFHNGTIKTKNFVMEQGI